MRYLFSVTNTVTTADSNGNRETDSNDVTEGESNPVTRTNSNADSRPEFNRDTAVFSFVSLSLHGTVFFVGCA
jgi:hypothetical protein